MASTPAPTETATAGSPGRLVIVDDEPALLELLVSLFRGQREVHAFTRGADALAHMRNEGLDVLLTDKNLPDVGGLDLLEAAKAVSEDAEVIVLTGYASMDTAIKALQRGAFDYIVKPPRSIFEVRRKVDEAFARQAIVRENRRLVDDLQRKNHQLRDALDENERVQAELLQSEKLAGIGTLAAGVAHEISSPLFGVLGLAEAIVDEHDLDTVHRHAGEIVEYARTIKEIVQQLAGYARSAEREVVGVLDAGDALRDAARLVTRSLGLETGRVVLEVGPSLPVRGRGTEVQQVFVNLLKNAIEAVEDRHGPGAGSVRATATLEGREVVVRVTDDGAGMPPEVQRRVFDPFFTTKAPGRGTGLGLNIVWRIVTQRGGSVSVDSEPGEGTTLTIRWPLADEEAT